MKYPTLPPSAITWFDNSRKLILQAYDSVIVPKMILLTVRAGIEGRINPSYADVAKHELPTVSGYRAGGLELPDLVVIPDGDSLKISSGIVRWHAYPGEIPAWRYACIYFNGVFGQHVDPLLCWFYGDCTPQDVRPTLEEYDLEIHCPSTGWFSSRDA